MIHNLKEFTDDSVDMEMHSAPEGKMISTCLRVKYPCTSLTCSISRRVWIR